MKAGGIILAGGKSSRMGTNKALLPVGAKTMIETIISVLRPLFPEIIVVTNEPELYQHLEVRLVKDIIPAKGPLSGIHAGLSVSPYKYNFVVACDMPFIEPKLISYMVEHADGYDVVVPRAGEYLEPLHAVYSKNCIPFIEDCLKKNVTKIIAFYPEIRLYCLDVEVLRRFGDVTRMFFNLNTPADLAQVSMKKASKDW
ncbi:putative molybdenum cofactor guanylyltransferase [Moorella thermoacetica]|uniref:Probable molybdenum cofactor guanylyltransferase n=2 Tax=Neomoorella thermoacetica TaxID=1525 RepID=A0AAC9MW50_NEOTH|nr:molybdenum cofactor guanylyltransferase [Moorella thermoacetica]AKX95016.1 molybdenum cofactor guanylyltransferase [Moorella thermoacetica]AKX97642.1 molybdenum cofactor guanylyltransferase [Moorella thermoacetica]AOQ25157.1 Molybdenum cofactor guanylyltransferase [Moorella thermoacetica]APC09414.1 molybdenum cofactor guanylyltransferase [Moorella thermoacetica]OIQ53947.1 molybdenum cofactor guanylyltransferase [Moorella thermoacetica]